MLLLLVIFAYALAQTPCGGQSIIPPPAACYPHKILPIAAPLLTYAPGERSVVVIGGDRGNAGAIVDRELAQGARVHYTCVEENADKRANYGPFSQARPALRPVPAGATRDELDLGLEKGPSSPERWVWRYMERNGFCLPDAVYNVGMDVHAGNLADYTADQLRYIFNSYTTGWLIVQSELKKFSRFPCNVNRSFTWFNSLSTGAFGGTDGVLYPYYVGHYARWKNIINENMQGLVPQWRHCGLACTFSNTTNWLTETNPSADRGDTAQLAFLAVTKSLTPAIGTTLGDYGLAAMQATTLNNLPEMQGPNPLNPVVQVPFTVFQVLPRQIPGANFTDWTKATFRQAQSALAGGQLEAYETALLLGGFQIPIGQHGAYTFPFYTPEGREWGKKK
jgi:hypothetical protein